MKQIVYLYSEIMPYNIPVIRELTFKGYYVHIFRWTRKCLTPYSPPSLPDVKYYDRSRCNSKQIFQIVQNINPSLVYISGWMDKGYCCVVRKVKATLNIPIIAGCDSQWLGGKQWVNVILSPFRHKCWYSHILVAGVRQYEYARRLGFRPNQILMHVYSADVTLFSKRTICCNSDVYPKQLLFIGRFAKEKGIKELVRTWINMEDHFGWTLKMIGNGPLKQEISSLVKDIDSIYIEDFQSQESLIRGMQKCGAFILPSTFEPWALVIHEAASAGLPIIASEQCGATPYFVINNYNGFLFDSKKTQSLKERLNSLFSLSNEELMLMGNRSRQLSERITPEIVANTILSVL